VEDIGDYRCEYMTGGELTINRQTFKFAP